ncbi:HPr family phosphocarrier protein [Trueperella pecoris]|uniref:Phosphocarrier protein HPr n=2 Tax=Trueperella pecoris TaxID=2733571 RepID=A0A7M1QZ84_9ACTO|nr:HPr family phosphocarrier protein [Trueperella pecoris]
MEVLRVFNNNVILAKDASRGGGEVIVTGRGVGFQVKAGAAVDPAKVARVFVPSDGRDSDHVAELLADIPLENITLMTDVIAAADLPPSLAGSATLLIALADHIGFAMRRAHEGLAIEYPLRSEVSSLYSEEFAQAQRILDLVNTDLGRAGRPTLPEGEAVALALHLVNAGFATGDLSFTYRMTGVLQQLIKVIEEFYNVSVSSDTVSVGRFITHLRYLFVRIHQHNQLTDEHSAVGAAIRDADPQAYRCAGTLASLIELRLDQALTSDEIAYLALHISRIAHSARAPGSRTTTSDELGDADNPSRKETPMITRTATIASAVGLHARPAALFTAAVEETGFDITISLDGEEADASSILEVMTLGAGQGDVVTLASEDEAAAGALADLAAMLERDLDAE